MRNQILLATLAACACIAANAAPRAYVSSTGKDNGRTTCDLADPCRTFQKAHDVVDPRGEVVALDGADFGPVSVAKSVSIIGSPGTVASIVVTAKDGVLIERPGVDVVLRNLHITGAGGLTGVNLRVGNSLTMENCVVTGLAADGIRSSAVADVRIVNSTVSGNAGHGAFFTDGTAADIMGSRFLANGGSGLYLETTNNNGPSATVNDSVASGNTLHGFAAKAVSGGIRMALTRVTAANNGGAGVRNHRATIDGVTQVTLGNSLLTQNAVGIENVFDTIAAIPSTDSMGDNIVRVNGVDVVGSVIPRGGI